jgi:hypothetical protein
MLPFYIILPPGAAAGNWAKKHALEFYREVKSNRRFTARPKKLNK